MTLFIVATPIGNLEDITLRAIKALSAAESVLAEDTRRTRILLDAHGIRSSVHSFHAHSTPRELERWLERLEGGAHVALVTDAGTPLVSDPGFRLVEGAIARGVRVESVPGASAALAAIACAGIACDAFSFQGFLPRKGKERAAQLAAMRTRDGATIIFESPKRTKATVAEIAEHVGGDRAMAVCRELTKIHEEVIRGTAAELASSLPDELRGEVTLVIAGRPVETEVDDEAASKLNRLATWLAERDVGPRESADALRLVSELSKTAAYDLAVAASSAKKRG